MNTTGIIIPPPEIKNLIDKTAKSVAQKGPELEELVKKNFADNPKFSFLDFGDPYRPYYDQKVEEYKLNGDEADAPEGENGQERPAKVEKKFVKPPEEYKWVYDCGSIGVMEADVMQHTAQFVAKNGQRFLVGLTEREKHNPLFDFLKPTHSLFPYFTALIDAYSRILDFQDKDYDALLTMIADKRAVLKACTDIYEYEAEHLQSRKRKEELEEEERAQRAMIDWNDFVVVQTIDFEDSDGNLPAPREVSKEDNMGAHTAAWEFNRANVNPDFASLVDASIVYAAREEVAKGQVAKAK